MGSQMKRLFSLLLVAMLGTAGCDNLADSVRSRLEPNGNPHVRVFSADEKTAYAAALAALDQIDFHFTHGGPAEGEMEALSSITHDADGSRQVSLAAEFRVANGGGTEVTVRMKEILETDPEAHLGQGTETPLRDTPLYEVFFRNISQELELKK
jgi:hypothetical protein